MAHPQLELAEQSLKISRDIFMAMLDTIPEDKLCHQPIPGANHALWIAGHLAVTDIQFRGIMGDTQAEVPEAWQTAFGMGSVPQSDPAACPPLAEVRTRLVEWRTALLEYCRGMSETQLLATPAGDAAQLAPTNVALLTGLAWHEGLHSGQLTSIRKSLGMKPVFM